MYSFTQYIAQKVRTLSVSRIALHACQFGMTHKCVVDYAVLGAVQQRVFMITKISAWLKRLSER